MNNYLEGWSLLELVMRWKKHLLIIGAITVLLAVLFSSPLFITPLFQSQSRIYPVHLLAYSEESNSEQMLEVILSTDIKWKMIETFDLANRYGINLNKPSAQSLLLKKYDEFISCRKTRYETIEISVMDADPLVACNMVDSLIAFYNGKMQDMQQQKYVDRLETYSNDLKRKEAAIDSLNSEIDHYRKNYGLLDYEQQTRQLTLGYAEILARGASRASADDVQKRLNLLAEKGGAFLQMQSRMRELEIQRNAISKDMEEAYSYVHSRGNFAVVVEKAYPADKKSYPTRWIIVLVSLFSVEFMAVLMVLFLEGLKKSKS